MCHRISIKFGGMLGDGPRIKLCNLNAMVVYHLVNPDTSIAEINTFYNYFFLLLTNVKVYAALVDVCTW